MISGFASLAVIVPTKNRPFDLDITVEGVFDQTVLPKQLIIVDQSTSAESYDRAVARYEALPSETRNSVELVYILDVSINGLTAARNRGMKDVRAEFVLFLDDDVILERNFNERIIAVYLEHPEAVGVSGIVTNYKAPPMLFQFWLRAFVLGPFWDDRQPVYWKADRLRHGSPVKVTRLGGGLMSFRVAAIGTVGFDENLHGACDGEDVEFCARLSAGPLFIEPGARLVHKQSPASRSMEHWLCRYARTMWYLYRRNWNYGIRNRLCLLWLNLGFGIAAAAVSIRRLSMDPYLSLTNSIRESRQLAGR